MELRRAKGKCELTATRASVTSFDSTKAAAAAMRMGRLQRKSRQSLHQNACRVEAGLYKKASTGHPPRKGCAAIELNELSARGSST